MVMSYQLLTLKKGVQGEDSGARTQQRAGRYMLGSASISFQT
jgi:hypothetical protein